MISAKTPRRAGATGLACLTTEARETAMAMMSAHPAPVPSRAVQGILCIEVAMLLFVAQDAVMKGLLSSYPVWPLLFARSVVAVLVLVPLIAMLGGPHSLRSALWPLHMARAFLFAAGFSMFYAAFPFMGLAEVSTIFFSAPLMTALMAALFLGERVGAHRVGALLTHPAHVALVGRDHRSLRPHVAVTEPRVDGHEQRLPVRIPLHAVTREKGVGQRGQPACRLHEQFERARVQRVPDREPRVLLAAKQGKHARTRWRCVASYPSLKFGSVSWLELWPHTGRTHQLRRHCAEALGRPYVTNAVGLEQDGDALVVTRQGDRGQEVIALPARSESCTSVSRPRRRRSGGIPCNNSFS